MRRSRVRAVKQARVTHWEDIELFLKTHKPKPFKIVIKPIRSAGSDNVYLCDSEDELKSRCVHAAVPSVHCSVPARADWWSGCLSGYLAACRFKQIIGHTNQLNITNGAVVVQEYLEGKEYVVDTVSRDGVHKCSAIWVYDKRAVNGAGQSFAWWPRWPLLPSFTVLTTDFSVQRSCTLACAPWTPPAKSRSRSSSTRYPIVLLIIQLDCCSSSLLLFVVCSALFWTLWASSTAPRTRRSCSPRTGPAW